MAPLKLLLPAVALLPLAARADVKLPSIFGDHMAVQRDMPLKVFGTAAPGEKVTVKLAGHERSAAAGQDGKWAVTLDPVKERGPYEMTVKGSQTQSPITFTDVIAGEVWLCTGQSNMGLQRRRREERRRGEAGGRLSRHPPLRRQAGRQGRAAGGRDRRVARLQAG